MQTNILWHHPETVCVTRKWNKSEHEILQNLPPVVVIVLGVLLMASLSHVHMTDRIINPTGCGKVGLPLAKTFIFF